MPVYTVQPDHLATSVFRSLRRRFVRALGLVLACLALFAAGFFAIGVLEGRPGSFGERWFESLWNTLNLVSTVGSLTAESTWERAWAMAAIVIGLGAVLYGFGALQALLHGDVARLLERRTMQRTLAQLADHIIVCGFGDVGRSVAADLARHGSDLVVIDRDEDAVAQADQDGRLAVEGDATREQTLREAGLERASGLIAALDADAANVYLILIAREIKPDLRIVSRADRAASRSTLRRAGADRAIAPDELAALQLSHLMLRPIVSEFIAAATGEGEYDFAELQVARHPALAGKTLRALDLPGRAEAIVISVVSPGGTQEFNPSGDRKLTPDDTLLLVCRAGGLERIAALPA